MADPSPPTLWCNVSGQVLEIGNCYDFIHRLQLLPGAFLTEDQYEARGFFIQRYIDLGWCREGFGSLPFFRL